MLLFSFYGISLVLPIVLVRFLSNWMVIWACLEIMTILFVVLLSYFITPRVVEAVAKYFITQAVASLFILFGVLLQYYSLGDLRVFRRYKRLKYVIILLGIFVKIAVFPKPFWFIDVVNGVKFLRSRYIIVISKIVPIYLFMKIGALSAQVFLTLVGVSSVTLGSLLGIKQTRIRKIVALSSVAHLGWLIVGFPYLSLMSCVFVFCCYLIIVLPLLWVAGFYEVKDLKRIKRLYSHPYFLVFLMLRLLKLASFPPLVGFFYKWIIFLGLVNKGQYLISFYLIIMSLVSLFFYLRLCLNILGLYWPEPKVSLLQIYSNSRLSWGPLWLRLRILLIITRGGVLGLGPLSKLQWF